MKCTNCGTEHDANFCPNCGTPSQVTQQSPQQQPVFVYQQMTPVAVPKKNKMPIGVKILLIVVGVIVAIGVIGSIAGQNASKSSGQVNTESTDTTISEQSAAPEVVEPAFVPLGTRVENGNVAVQINGSSETTVIKVDDSGYFKYEADAGTKYIVVNVTLENISKDMERFTISDFQLKTEDGTKYSPTVLITTGSDDYITFESFNPGISKTGNIAFVVPEGVDISTLYLSFQQFLSINSADFEIQ